MADGKKKRDWFRWLVDLLVMVIFVMLTWAGSVLWEISKTQAVITATQATTTEMLENIQERTRELEIWKAETSANRFTSANGKELWIELRDLKEYVVALPLGEPPNWFVSRVDALDHRIDKLEQRVNKGE